MKKLLLLALAAFTLVPCKAISWPSWRTIASTGLILGADKLAPHTFLKPTGLRLLGAAGLCYTWWQNKKKQERQNADRLAWLTNFHAHEFSAGFVDEKGYFEFHRADQALLEGSGNAVVVDATHLLANQPFTKVQTHDGLTIKVTQGPLSLNVTLDDNLQPLVTVKVVDGSLEIGMSAAYKTRGPRVCHLTVPSKMTYVGQSLLQSFSGSSAAHRRWVNFNGARNNRFFAVDVNDGKKFGFGGDSDKLFAKFDIDMDEVALKMFGGLKKP